MTAHPNRRRGPASNPDPAAIRAARETANLTPAEASALVYSTAKAWQDWESGQRRMHPAIWELWQLKVSQRR